MFPTLRVFLLPLLTAVTVAPAFAGEARVREGISNWTAPATWTPARSNGSVRTMTDISNALPLVSITPCRIADTRAGQGFTGQAGPPALNTGTRTFAVAGFVAGIPAQCGIPSGAAAVSFQFTIIFPNSAGNLIAWPAGGPVPNVSVLNWSAGETALGNGTVVPVNVATGGLSVRINAAVGSATGDVAIDVNGYYGSGSTDPSVPFVWETDNANAFGAARIRNLNKSEIDVHAITAFTDSSGNGSSGVRGIAADLAGRTYGLFGTTSSTASDAAGVYGYDGTGPAPSTPILASGVRGTSSFNFGVLGVTSTSGTAAIYAVLTNAGDGAFLASASLGRRVSGTNYGVFTDGALATLSATKMFVEPHPTDPSKAIRYVSLEGNEAGTYFRGRAKFERGVARIRVPEDFRLVTAEEGLSVQVTPIGRMASVAVVKVDLNEIVVESSRNVEFFYTVNGVRRMFPHWEPIVSEAEHFMPQSADARIPSHMPEEHRRRLVSNGTYNADGTLNRQTARRLGWDEIWEKRSNAAASAPPPGE